MSSFRLLFALLCLGLILTAGAEVELIQSTSSRYGISRNGSWRVIVDPYESGYYDYRYQPQADGATSCSTKARSGTSANSIAPPPLMTDWWNYGGLTRPVRIIDVPGTFVQNLAPTRRQTATAGI